MSLDTMRIGQGGTAFKGLVARPQGPGPHPAVLVMQSALGLRHMVAEKVQALPDLGYLAVATDMYGVGADTSTPEKAGAHYIRYHEQPALLCTRCVAWFDAVAARGDVDAARGAAIGYCFGGRCALELARSGADLRAAVSYHGLLTTHAPAGPGDVRGEVWHPAGPHPGDRHLQRQPRLEAGRAELMKLCADADVFLTNLLPPARASMEIDGRAATEP